MFKSMILIAFRNLIREKAYSAMNMIGLIIGMTCSLFLYLYILDELSYDRYHRNADELYRIVSSIKEPDNAFTWSVVQMPLGEELRDHYPEVKNVVRFWNMQRDLFRIGERKFHESDFFFADSTVFDTFSYDFIVGDPHTALDNPHSVVLTEKVARKYFDDPLHAVNQSLHAEANNEDFKITGVIRDVPLNSHFRFDALISRSSRPKYQGNWGNFGITTYVQLPPGYDLSRMLNNLDKIIKEKVSPIFDPLGIKVKYELQPITSIHLYSKISDEAEAGGDMSYIYIFSAVALFMLLIACINYMNLATARSANRSREVGLRKVMGSLRVQLVMQFLTESLLMTVVSLVVSLGLIYLLMPSFNTLASKQLYFSSLLQPQVLAGLVSVMLITGIIGGSYPAFYLSGFNPVQVLKGKLATRGGGSAFRRFLVVVQFGLSIFMLISTLIVFDQLSFLRNKDLGFNKENVVRLNLTSQETRVLGKSLVNQLLDVPGVLTVGRANAAPGEGIGKLIFKVEDKEGKMVDRGVDLFTADYDFVPTLGMKITQGRNFSKDNPGDTSHAVLVNESMVARMGWKDPIGRRFESGGRNGIEERKVIGVIHDYNQNSLYDAIEPLIIVLDNEFDYVFVRLAPGDTRTVMKSVEKVWNDIFRDQPLQYTFLDQDLDSQYKADEKRSRLFTLFSALTIGIACLGLLGLAAYSTEQRTREMGIRKVMGATVQGLVLLISREFFLWVGIGTVVAIPAAWYFTHNWLQKLTYRVDLAAEWPTFLISIVLAFVITMVTVSYHVVRTAMANPVDSLRAD